MLPRLDDRSTTDPGDRFASLDAMVRGAQSETAVAEFESHLAGLRRILPQLQNPKMRDRLTMMLAVSDHDPDEPGSE